MPLDQTTYTPAETKPDLSKPSLEGLSWLLRRQMPPSHVWNFREAFHRNECGTVGCAIGVGCAVWPEVEAVACVNPMFGTVVFGAMLGLSQDDSYRLFSASRTSANENYGKDPRNVTPRDVADAIDRYIAARG